MIPSNIKKEHILKAIEYIDKNGVPPGRGSTVFVLEYDGKRYPPKYVISIANKYANGEELDGQKFISHEANRVLSRLDFKIVTKNLPPPPPKDESISEKINESIKLLWEDLEKALRKCVSQEMSRKYGKFWMEELEKQYPQLTYGFNKWRESAGEGKNKFPSNDIVDKADADTLFNIIRYEWHDIFSSIFKGHPEYRLPERGKFLVYVRNKLFHSQSDKLSVKEMDLAKEYMLELLDILKPYQDTQVEGLVNSPTSTKEGSIKSISNIKKDVKEMRTLCIVPCGKKKIWDENPNAGPTKARDVYIGPFATKCREYALKFYPDSWCIFSSKYGFLFPDELIPENYEARFGDPTSNTISMEELFAQAKKKNLYNYDCYVVLGGKEYVNRVKEVFKQKKIITPISGLSGIGEMMHRLDGLISKGC